MRRLLLTTASVIAVGLGGFGVASAHIQTKQSALSGSSTPTAMSQTQKTGTRTATHHARMTRTEVKQAQRELRADKLYRGRIDGIFGPQTKTALERYQRKNNLPVTARLDQRTMTGLSGGSAGQGASMTPRGTQGRMTSQGTGSSMPKGASPDTTMGQGSTMPSNGTPMNPSTGHAPATPGPAQPMNPAPTSGTTPNQK